MSVQLHDPFSGAPSYRYDYDRPDLIESRLTAAALAFPAWASTPIAIRSEHLRALAATLRAQRETLASTITADMGKLRREALAEVEKSAAACDYYAETAPSYLAELPIVTEAARSYVRYEPLGAVLAVMPWNFPIWQVFRFLAPSLMAGNVTLLKHATQVPRCADAIAAVCRVAGLPEGVFAALHMDNAGSAGVIGDPRIAALTLTGSERAGRSVAATAGQHLKKCVLELGGSDPFVVLADADLDQAIPAAIASRFGNAGQTCIAAKRFIVEEGIAGRFVEAFVEAAKHLRLGDPNDAATGLAPMARSELREELHGQVLRSLAAGAQLLVGGTPAAGANAYPATILDRVCSGMPAYDEELFGPVASILRVRDAAEALRVANDTRFGLGASVWTGNAGAGEAFARGVVAGATFVNATVRSDVRLPFGGAKQSGFGRELGAHGITEFCNIKTVYVA